MFETLLDHNKRGDTKKHEREDDDEECVAETGIDAERVEELVGPPEVTVNRLALEFRSVEAENSEKAGVETVLEEGAVEQPVPAKFCIFFQNEKAAKECEDEDGAGGDDERVLDICD